MQQGRDLLAVTVGAALDEVEDRGRRGQVTVAQPAAELGAVHAPAATPWRSATSATMSRMIRVMSKSLGE